MEQVGQLIVGIMGGGLVATIPIVVSAIQKLRQGRLDREDTAIKQWREFAETKERDAAQAWRIVGDFRKWYYRLWAQYVRVTGDDVTYPPDPVNKDEQYRKVLKEDVKQQLESNEAE